MKYFLDHDWQGNMQTPKKKVGEKSKINFLIIFASIYIIFGLFDHSPWRPLETDSFSIFADIFFNKNIISANLASNEGFGHAHLYEVLGAIFSKIFFFLEPHNAARLSNIIWISIAMLSIGLTNRELRGFGYGRQSNIIFLSSVGLFIALHSFNYEIAILTASALSLYAFSLSQRRPFRASILLGSALTIGIFTKGLFFYLPILGITLSLALLPNWNAKRLFIFSSIAYFCSVIILSIWLFLLSSHAPESMNQYLNQSLTPLTQNLKYYLVNLLWFAWPAIPLFFWTLFKEIDTFFKFKRTHLPIIFIFWFLILLISESSINQTKLMILLPAISILASSSIDSLQRGASSALNWFGILIFSSITLVLWIGWFAFHVGIPFKLHERMLYLSGNLIPEFNLITFLLALTFLSLWIFSLLKNKLTNRSTVTNWALGITLVWVTIALLWFPMIENRKNYGQVYQSIQELNLSKNECLNSNDLNASHIDLIFYYTQLIIKNQSYSCAYTIGYSNLARGSELVKDKKNILWTGKMPNDRKSFYIIKN
ncbi:MAG: ArnT family glycosyltransferase [Methylophilaceae bacterium]